MTLSLAPVRIIGLAALLAMATPALAHDRGEALLLELGGPFSLIDHNGEPRSREDFHGEFRIIYFGYTKCPYTCSTAAANIAAALDELAAGGAVMGALFITIDPTFDTPQRLAEYVMRIHPRMIGLTGAAAEIERLAKSFQVHATEAADKGGFERLIEHQPLAFLMGPEGGILTLFPPLLPAPEIARIIRGYLVY